MVRMCDAIRHDPEHMARLQSDRANHAFLPGIEFPSSLIIESDLAKVVKLVGTCLLSYQASVFSDVLAKVHPHLRSDSRLCWATKGLEPETGRLLQDVATEIIGDTYPLAVLSGPTFAKELAMQVCLQQYPLLHPIKTLLLIFKTRYIAVRPFECMPIAILSACSLGVRLRM